MAEKILVRDARHAEQIGKQVLLQGWVRTRRDSKAGFSFIELNDGSCQGNIQVIADAELPNYESEIKSLTAGCSVSVEGEIKESGGKGQVTEVQARERRKHPLPPFITSKLQQDAARQVGFGVLNVLQTIPSIALFGLLLAPLAWLSAHVDWLSAVGVSGIGWAPALLALVGYSLLPMVRNTFVACTYA